MLVVQELVYQKVPHYTLLLPATCRPRTWMQQLTEGQISEPQDGDNITGDSSIVETLPEGIPDELGCEWRVLHPFDLP